MRQRIMLALVGVALLAVGNTTLRTPIAAGNEPAPVVSTPSTDQFLAIPGIPGGSHDAAHSRELEILSWSWGVVGAPTTGTVGGTAARPSIGDIELTAPVSKATPKLALAAASGTHFPEAKLTVRKAGENPLEYLVITMTDVLVTEFKTATGPGGHTDAFSLSSNTTTIEFVEQKADGSPGDRTSAQIPPRK